MFEESVEISEMGEEKNGVPFHEKGMCQKKKGCKVFRELFTWEEKKGTLWEVLEDQVVKAEYIVKVI